MLLTFILVLFGWILFRADSIGQAWQYIQGVFTASLFNRPDISGVTGFSLAICIMLVVEWFQRNKKHALDLSGLRSGTLRYAAYLALLFLTFALGGHAENFIYFQF